MSTVARTSTASGHAPQVGRHYHPNESIAMMRTVLLGENASLHTIAGTMIAIRPVTAPHRLQTVRYINISRKTSSAIRVVSDITAIANCRYANHDRNV